MNLRKHRETLPQARSPQSNVRTMSKQTLMIRPNLCGKGTDVVSEEFGGEALDHGEIAGMVLLVAGYGWREGLFDAG